jgi:hypothetical protein
LRIGGQEYGSKRRTVASGRLHDRIPQNAWQPNFLSF